MVYFVDLEATVLGSHAYCTTFSTLCVKKVYALLFDNNIGEYGPIFKIHTPVDS